MRAFASILVVFFVFCGLPIIGAAMAADAPVTPDANAVGSIHGGGGRIGGDTVMSAVAIPALPFYDSGSTCSFADDYDEACPYTGSPSPDVVYSFVPYAHMMIDISLCASNYDTKMYMYENAPGNPIACSDDACGATGWQSRLCSVSLYAGNTYYIVVDGYGGECGTYAFEIADGVCYSAGIEDDTAAVVRPMLLPAGPNPVVLCSAGGEGRGWAFVRFALPGDARVELDIYGPSGRHVRALGGEVFSAGTRSIAWDGCDANGRAVAAGSYFYRLSVAGEAMDGETLNGRIAIVR